MLTIWQLSVLMTTVVAVPPATGSASLTPHEKGVLQLANRRLASGDTVRVVGDKFSPRAKLSLMLLGVAGRVRLGEVQTDTAGAFVDSVALPLELAPGSYRLVAVAADGDEVATLDVEVVAASSLPTETHDVHEEIAEPTSEPLKLDRARSPWVSGGALASIVLALAAAGALLRRTTGSNYGGIR